MNQVALVTGAGKRIGQAIAVYLAEIGYDVVVHYSSSQAGAEETKAKIENMGRTAYLIQSDLAETYAPKELIGELAQRVGRLDLLVNSASTYPEPDRIQSQHSFEKESEEEWEEAIAVNTRAPFFLIKYASKLLEKSENGLIINILDRSVDEMIPSRTAHTVSKNALKVVSDLGARSFAGKFRICSLLLGRIIPGERMSEEEVAAVRWVGIEPVLEEVGRITAAGENGATYFIR